MAGEGTERVSMQTGSEDANVAVQHDPNVKIDHHGQGQISEENLTDHDKAMLAKVDENHKKALQANGELETEATPADKSEFTMPEKFAGKSAEDIAKAYVELEKMKSKGVQENEEAIPQTPKTPRTISPKEDSEKTDLGGDPKASQEEGKTDVQTDGQVNFDKYISEMSDTGTLKPESRAELIKAGYPETLIDFNLNQVNAVTELITSKIHAMAGSEENYNTMLEWAKEGLNDFEKEDFDEKISSGNMGKVQIGLNYLKNAYEAKNGTLGAGSDTLLTGGKPAGAAQVKPYANWTQVTADQGSDEYQKDPAFRAMVEKRLAVSNI